MKRRCLLLFALLAIALGAKALDVNGHEYVDLGLPSGTLWATCNVGANSPEECGDYFAWGETEPKTTYNLSTYFDRTCEKYNISGGLTELQPEDDAATVNWGSGWQIPSYDQLNELINYTTSEWAIVNGFKCRKITSEINGNSIFLPAAGYSNDEAGIDAGNIGYYWLRSLNPIEDPQFASRLANTLEIYKGLRLGNGFRYEGYTVRPVYNTPSVEAYAVFTEDGTLAFYQDNRRFFRSGVSYPIYRYEDPQSFPSWYEKKEQVTRVVFDPSFANARPNTARFWFYYMINLESIDGLQYLNTSEVKDMYAMFGSCRKLTSLDLSSFNTSKVTSMTSMFSDCEVLTSLNVSNFNTSKVTDMSGMFSLTQVTSLELGSFNTSSVTNMSSMFSNCRSLTSLDLSSFNTSNVTNMNRMFFTCTEMTTIYVGRRWNTEKVTQSQSMFDSCYRLVGEKGTTYNVNHVDASYAHIDGGTSNPGYLTGKIILSYDFEYNGIFYNDMGNGLVEVTYEDKDYGTYSGTVVIPEVVEHDGGWYTVSDIGERAFYRCPYLTSVTIPATVGIIHNDAFVDAFLDLSNSSITCYATMPPTVSPFAFDSGIQYMTLYVMPGCKATYEAAPYWKNFGTIVELPYSFVVDGIYYKITGDGTVSVSYKDSNYNCYSGDIVIPSTVTSGDVTYTVTKIDNLAFFNCTGLTSVSIPETVIAIGSRAFKNCSSLTNFVVPNSVTSIGVNAFENCEALSVVTLGSGLKSIGDYAFYGCTELIRGNVTCLAPEPPTISPNTFVDQYQGANLYVPYGCHDVYTNAAYWKNFYDIYELPAPIVTKEFSGTLWQTVVSNGQSYSSSETNKTVTLTSSADTPDLVDIAFPDFTRADTNDNIAGFEINDVNALDYVNGSTLYTLPEEMSMILQSGIRRMPVRNVMVKGAKSKDGRLILKLTMTATINQTKFTLLFGPNNMTFDQIKTVLKEAEDIITGVDGVEIDTKDDVIYDLSGRKIEKITQPGIYIKNGKKIMVK